MQDVCLVIPCYNEERRLRGNDFFEFLEAHPRSSFCFVNDGSSDATLTVLESLRRTNPERIQVLNLTRNCGKAEAVRRGVLHLSLSQRYAAIGYWDADLSTPLRELEPLLAALERDPACRMAIGSRVKRLGSTIDRRGLRHLLGRIFSTLASIVLRLPVYDSQCGAKVFRPDIVEIMFADRFATRWLFDVEILARLRNELGIDGVHKAVNEVPLNAWIEVGGSKLRLRHMMRVPLDLLKIRLQYNKERTSATSIEPAAHAQSARGYLVR